MWDIIYEKLLLIEKLLFELLKFDSFDLNWDVKIFYLILNNINRFIKILKFE